MECQTLKDKIEEHIQDRHLRRFVQGGRSAKRSPWKEELMRRRDYTRLRAQKDDRRSERWPRREDPPRREFGRHPLLEDVQIDEDSQGGDEAI